MNFSFDKRAIWVILGLLMITSLRRYITNPEALLTLFLTIPGVLIAITFHEFAHAYVADKLGDDTPRMQGRLNLNPLSHMDPIGSLLLLTAGFGWGKPVEINPRNFKREITLSKGEALVSIAGPAMNFLLAILFTIIYYIFGLFNIANIEIAEIIGNIILYTVMINIGLGVFNLIPLPPLDGSKILMHFLPYNGKKWFQEKQMIFYIIFVVIWITDIASIIITPAILFIYTNLFSFIGWLFQLF